MGDNWELPKPVFRSTSGSLPQDFVERVGTDARPQAEAKAPHADDQILSSLYAPPDEKVEESSVHEPPPTLPSVADIEPQPVISEQFSVDEIDTVAPDKPAKKGGSGSAMLVIGTLLIMAIIGGILALVYVLVFRRPPETPF